MNSTRKGKYQMSRRVNKRSNGERKRRGNSRYYLFFSFSLVFLFALLIGGWYGLSRLPLLNLSTLHISGNTAVPDSLIIKHLEPHKGTNLLKLPLGRMSKDIKSISRVKNVKLRRQLLSSLKVQITERQGVLYVKSFEGRLYPIDQEAIVMQNYGFTYNEDLPIYSSYYTDSQFKPGVKLAKADLAKILKLHMKIVNDCPEYLPIISEYYMIDNTINIIDARYGTRIIPSEDNIAAQLKRYQFVQDNGNIKKSSIVDLRFENQVVVKGENR